MSWYGILSIAHSAKEIEDKRKRERHTHNVIERERKREREREKERERERERERCFGMVYFVYYTVRKNSGLRERDTHTHTQIAREV